MFRSLRYEYIIKKYKFYKHLVVSLKTIAGRSQKGQITHKGRGGGLKKYYRLIDFYRYLNYNIPCFIVKFEYDPNRNGLSSYVLTPSLVKLFDFYYLRLFKIGEVLPIIFGFSGMLMYNVQYIHYKKAQLGRAAGSFIILLRKVGEYVLSKLKSKEELYLLNYLYINIGKISGELNKLFKYLKAGVKRNLGLKMKIRGVAKNPIDHPHGGGSGRTTAGRPSVTP
jgi:large subunit ribosomal protein L2